MIRAPRIVAAAALGLGLSLGAPLVARADEPKQVDPLVAASATTLSAGAAMAVAGGVLWSLPDPEETVCGARAGCATVARASDTRAPGTFLTGAGIADILFGGVALTVVALRPPGRMKSPALATTGLSLTAASIGMLGGGLFLGGLGQEGRFDQAAPWLVASGVSFAVGVPLLAAGAQSSSSPSIESPGLVAGGSILLIGGLAGFGRLLYAAIQAPTGGFIDLEGPLLGLGAVSCLGAGLGAGIPMLVIGAREPIAAPALSISPSRVDATWRF